MLTFNIEDILFIVVFHWGIRGMTLATVVAQASTFITGAVYLTKKHQ